MSINWVMLDPKQAFVRLPAEKPICASPARTGLAISTPGTYPGNNPLSIHSKAGIVYLTNQRIVYLPATSTPEFQSFSCPLTHLHDTRVSAPLFGPNIWQAVVQPVSGGGLPSTQAHIELKLTFKDGGAYEFHINFERIKERLYQVMQEAGESNTSGSSWNQAGGPIARVNMDAVHLEELPTYQDSRRDELAPQPAPPELRPSLPVQQQEPTPSFEDMVQGRVPTQRQSTPHTDAPPGYEEAQQQSVQHELEERLAQVS